jgi:phosphomannomutase
VIILKLSENAKIISRPSGTEPKIKFYFTTSGRINNNESPDELIKRVNGANESLEAAFLEYLEI